jgi:hypothetical protein
MLVSAEADVCDPVNLQGLMGRLVSFRDFPDTS